MVKDLNGIRENIFMKKNMSGNKQLTLWSQELIAFMSRVGFQESSRNGSFHEFMSITRLNEWKIQESKDFEKFKIRFNTE